ncbi:MAG: phosphoribosylformylglycinamidine synthase subunit PurS [Patescibacteria group bacterium]|nr:phosphoribosylformylglycinamidine synthase subunit PurS [Patescibacteria group bacterium]MDE2172708.1 phosphoribosylformylglycinamidine synthase subunit PurS [Patescibacteria group bacterium]
MTTQKFYALVRIFRKGSVLNPEEAVTFRALKKTMGYDHFANMRMGTFLEFDFEAASDDADTVKNELRGHLTRGGLMPDAILNLVKDTFEILELTALTEAQSPCCGRAISLRLEPAAKDSICVGFCTACIAPVARIHPFTDRHEWLDGHYFDDPTHHFRQMRNTRLAVTESAPLDPPDMQTC